MNYFKKMPIGIQMSLLVVFIIMIVLFIIFTSYIKSANVVEKKNNEYFTEMISQMNQTVSSNTDGIKRIIQNIAYNSVIVQDYLTETNPIAKYEKYEQLKGYISDMISLKDGIVDIALIGTSGTKFNIRGDINELLPFEKEIPDKQLYFFTGLTTLPFNNVEKDVFVAGCPIYSITDFVNNGRIGTLMVVLEANAILGSPAKETRLTGNKIYALDRNSKVFYTNDDEIRRGSLFSETQTESQETKYLVQNGEIPDIGGAIIFKLPKSDLLSGIDEIRRLSVIIVLIAFLLLAVPFFLVINNIIRPLKKLMQFMGDFKLGRAGYLNKRISLQGYAEINLMANHFNRMLDELQLLTNQLVASNTRLYKVELVKKQSELAFLQSQINPHFLYNTLESIKGIAVEEGSEKIFSMARALGLVFRYSVKGTDVAPLREELTMLKGYLYIQQIRFAGRFETSILFPDEILDYRVPKMILQPLVENAIVHGLETKNGLGLLELNGTCSEEALLLSVKDNGPGIESERLQIIQALLSDRENPVQHSEVGIGLLNVNNRIRLSYGDKYGINVRSEEGEGTEIIITIPLEECF
ncbi:sensor histidine kinase [Paenibacillus monticola]|uniref:histidine kinase n=1 Tax=Paenibacillus monticola TaxID=2666075 RepID=A0A7X2H5C6_9BACL|nr:sensor histidine kinase [Paenibacillus monticola]MRN53824.1 HAMP domain-containing protein [Paenibacillus monticola]